MTWFTYTWKWLIAGFFGGKQDSELSGKVCTITCRAGTEGE